ncbi:hypothetical protein Lal_00012629 [Lupinus albus]|nr:hypothetical protein Lal_00012629 [Lupinus albus]
MDRSIIDTASSGVLGDMTHFEARSLIEKMTSNSQQFNAMSGDGIIVTSFHDVGTNAARKDKLESKIDSLTTLITQLTMNQQKSTLPRVCGIFTSTDHSSDICPSLFEPRIGDHPEAHAANIYNKKIPHQLQNYDPPLSTYNRAQPPFSIPLLFPPKIIPRKKIWNMEELDKDLLDTFRKVEVNIPLLDAIKQIPRYAKFLKELCTHNRKLKGNERMSIGRDVSAMMGALINVMHMNVFKFLSLGPLQPTGVVIQLANRSTAYLPCLVEDVLVRVDPLIFSAEFYILDMEERSPCNIIPIILGRPLLRTSRTKIDVHVGTLYIEFNDKVVRFNIFDALKHPSEGHYVFNLDLIHEFSDKHLSNFLHDFHASSLTDPYSCHACTNSELCTFCIDGFLDSDVPSHCTSLYTCHACTNTKMCDFCIDKFLEFVVDSPITHSYCTNTIIAAITQQTNLLVQVQDARKPISATFCNKAYFCNHLSGHSLLTFCAMLLFMLWELSLLLMSLISSLHGSRSISFSHFYFYCICSITFVDITA